MKMRTDWARDHTAKIFYWRTIYNANIRYLNLNNLDFSPGNPVKELGMYTDLVGDTSAYFKPEVKLISMSSGDYNVRAVKSGVVSYSGEDLKGYGNVIIIDHGDEIYSVYAYADKVFVSKGEFVNQGETIAALSPQHPVLHFEIRKGHKPVDPLYYLGGIND